MFIAIITNDNYNIVLPKLISKLREHGKKKHKQSNYQTGFVQTLRWARLT